MKISWKGSTQLSPHPAVLVTSAFEGKQNILTIAWTGIVCTRPPMCYISVMKERFSYDLIDRSREFVINLCTEDMIRTIDYCGVKSGKSENKFEKLGIKTIPGETVGAPVLCDSPISLECRVTQKIELGSHDMFLAEIINVRADERFIDKNGKLDLSKARLIAYSHGEYYPLEKSIGKFGFTVKKKNTVDRRQ